MSQPRAIQLLAASARLVRAAGQNDPKNAISPCMSVCVMDEGSGLCRGCLRTLDEIAQWGRADSVYKRAVWARIEDRVDQLPALPILAGRDVAT